MKISKPLSLLLVGGLFSCVFAHSFWVTGTNQDKFSADIGYGHDFPKPEAINENRIKLFEPLVLIDKSGAKTELKQMGENYHYEGEKLQNGTYILLGKQKAMFSVKDNNNKWYIDKTKEDMADIQICRLMAMSAKEIINIGDANDDFVAKPLGEKIEIVPLGNPANFKVGKPFKLQVLSDKKPLKTVRLTGTFDGFLKGKQAFLGTTDLEGITEVVALKSGKWIFEVAVNRPYEDTKKCDTEVLKTTIVFDIKD